MTEEKQKSVKILTHLQQEGSSLLGDLLWKRGLAIESVSVPRANLQEINPLQDDLLVIMGGPIGVYQADDYPFLKTEIDIVKARMKAKKPTMGICLGAQIMAAAMGANVYQGAAGKELGWHAISVNEDGKQTPARHLDAPLTGMFHWHGDTFDLPEDTRLLASSAKYKNQIFARDNYAIGMQCHPEVYEKQLEEWYVMFHRQITGPDAVKNVHDLRRDTRQNIETLNKQAGLFFTEWLDQAGV
ncbi:MAG: homoserine O-acetyltransferase/O-succinyltransferase family protein [Bdellovibrionales bacterium]